MNARRHVGDQIAANPRRPACGASRDVGPSVAMCRDQVRRWLRVPAEAVLVVSQVQFHARDEITSRLLVIERLFEDVPPLGTRIVFVQLAPAFGWTVLEGARSIVERINRKFGDGSHHPAVLLEAEADGEVSRRFEQAADLRWTANRDAVLPFVPESIAVEPDRDR